MMKKVITALSAAAVIFGCAREEVTPPVVEQEQNTSVSDGFIKGEVIVKLSDELSDMVEKDLASGSVVTKSAGLNTLMSEIGVKSMHRLFPDAGEYEERTRREGLHKWYVLEYDENIPSTKAGDMLSSLDGIELVEKCREIKTDAFNDPYFSQQWGYVNNTKKDFDINVSEVWNNYTTGDPKVIVSIVDQGVDLTHPDLSWNCLSSGHYNAVTDNSGITAGDHGTHVAGTVAAVNNNGLGVSGVAGGDYAAGQHGVSLMSCQIFGADGSSTAGASAAAIKWGADHGAVISQNSWGYNFDANQDGSLTGSEYTNAMAATISSSDKAAVDYFIKYAGCDNAGNQKADSPMKGGVVIFAAGNDGIENGAPANYEPIIAVGSVARDGTKSSFSNFGSWCDIAAPGSGIISTLPSSTYGSMDGTSMACPHVSGVAALVVSYCGGPGFTNDMLKEKLLGSANKTIISQAYKIGGLVDALGAITYGADASPKAVTDLTATGRSNNIDLTWTLTGAEDGTKAFGYLVLYGKDRSAVANSSFQKPSAGVSSAALSPDGNVGTKVSASVTGLDFGSKYYVKMAAYSYGRNYSEGTAVQEITTGENNPPVITLSEEGELSLRASEVLEIDVNIADPDGHDFTVAYTKGSAADVMSKRPSGNWLLVITGKDAVVGSYTGVITAKDSYGATTEYQVKYTIRENQAPVLLKDMENRLETSRGEFQIDMTEYFSDPDGDKLSYSVDLSDKAVAYFTPSGNTLIGTVLKYGHTTVTVTAKDAAGASATASFVLLAREKSTAYIAYPNPVTTTLNLATGEEKAGVNVKIVSQTGAVVIDQTVTASAFEPAKIDFKNVAPGRYSATFTINSKEYKQTIIKK